MRLCKTYYDRLSKSNRATASNNEVKLISMNMTLQTKNQRHPYKTNALNWKLTRHLSVRNWNRALTASMYDAINVYRLKNIIISRET